MNEYKPQCFKPGKNLQERFKNNPQKMEKEFYKQLKAKEDGINSMEVEDYNKNRKAYTDLKDKVGSKKARALLTQGGKAQDTARSYLHEEIKKLYCKQSCQKNNPDKNIDIDKAAAEQADKHMEQLAALHDPDLIAGGEDRVKHLGNKNVNSSLGAQWKDKKDLQNLTT